MQFLLHSYVFFYICVCMCVYSFDYVFFMDKKKIVIYKKYQIDIF